MEVRHSEADYKQDIRIQNILHQQTNYFFMAEFIQIKTKFETTTTIFDYHLFAVITACDDSCQTAAPRKCSNPHLTTYTY